MSLNAVEIGAVCEVLNRDLFDAAVQEVYSSAALRRVVLKLRSPGATHFLQFVLHCGVTRIGRIESKPHSSPTPHPFVMLLRRTLTGARVVSVRQLNQDRVAELSLEKSATVHRLTAELTSRHANLFLIGTDHRIIGSFFPNRSNLRKLVPGEPYTPPFPHPLSKAVVNRFEDPDAPETAIEAHYTKQETEEGVRARTAGVRRLVTKARQRAQRLRKNLEADRARALQAQASAHLGHVLKANLHRAQKGLSGLDAVDFEGCSVVIPLDPKLGPVANMEQLFKKAKRFGNATPDIEERLQMATREIESLEALDKELPLLSPKQLDERAERLVRRFPFLLQGAGEKRSSQGERLPYRSFSISGGRLAMVGRSARDNDTLTLRYAKPFDLWLHVRGGTGSHVVVPMGRKEDPAEEMLIDAAHLAAHYSTFKNDSDVEVIYTRRRHVQKPKGAPPGSVRLLSEKTIQLRMEPARLDRILNRGEYRT